MGKNWNQNSWKEKKGIQMPVYADAKLLEDTINELATMPPLVTSWEIEKLRDKFALAEKGKVFVLQGGDCAESFIECTSDFIVNKLKVLLQMSLVLSVGLKKPIVRIGRMAGQYAKPRSADTETRDGVTLPSYRGDIINGIEFTEKAREPNPVLMLRGYEKAALVMNFVRALTEGGFADLHHPENWNIDFVKGSPMSREYERILATAQNSLQFFETITQEARSMHRVSFFSSHEGLHLPYEAAQTRFLKHRNYWYNLSTHFPWIGFRTTNLDEAHIEYFRGIRNPVGVKVGTSTDPDKLKGLIETLNPDNQSGRLVFIARFGADQVETGLPTLIQTVKDLGANVTWISDPMHGNTETSSNGYKTRSFDKISKEIQLSLQIHQDLGSHLGGVHLELSGDNVTECIGGASGISEADLSKAYKTQVDPRLNYEQSIEIAMMISNNFNLNHGLSDIQS